MKSNEKKSLEKIASLYHSEDLGGINNAYHFTVRDVVIPADGGTSALELGCGSGMWTGILCERYERVDVVDASPELLNHVQKKYENEVADLVCHEALIEEFRPNPGQTWEHIYLTFLIEHLIDPVGILRLMRTWLSPEGCIFVAVPNAQSLHRELAVRMGMLNSVTQLSENDVRLGHRRVYSMDLLSEHLKEAGYDVVEQYQIGLKPLNLAQMKEFSPALAGAFCGAGDLAGKYAAYIAAKCMCEHEG